MQSSALPLACMLRPLLCFYSRLYTYRILHFASVFMKYTTKHSPYAYRFSFKFCVSLMLWNNKLWYPLMFHANADTGVKCEEKKMQNVKKITRNTSLHTLHLSHFVLFRNKCIAGSRRNWLSLLCFFSSFHSITVIASNSLIIQFSEEWMDRMK